MAGGQSGQKACSGLRSQHDDAADSGMLDFTTGPRQELEVCKYVGALQVVDEDAGPIFRKRAAHRARGSIGVT